MNNKNSAIILCKNIKLDKDYKNVLSYTESEMLTLCQNNAVVSANNYTFIRQDRNEIKVDFPYSTCLQCNYMAFQNPNYSNKWFFAFIDEVSYISDNATRISFIIDEHSTWFDYWFTEPCLVLREHVNSDLIGEHTYPENLEHGDYMINNYTQYGDFDCAQCLEVVSTTWVPSNTPGLVTNALKYGGVQSGTYYVVFPDNLSATNFIKALDGFGRGDAILSIFMIPPFLSAPISQYTTATLESYIDNNQGGKTRQDFTINFAIMPSTNGNINFPTTKAITINNTIDGYTPKNNKLFTAQFNYLLMSNNNGGNVDFHYEDFINNTPTFQITGTISPGCSIKCYPTNYKGYQSTSPTITPGFNNGLMAGKFPIGSYQNDTFINWMTQQSVNNRFAKIGTLTKIGSIFGNIASGGLGATDKDYTSLFNQQASYLSELYEHALVPPQANGNTNGGDISFASDNTNFSFYQMSIKAEYARKIDEYFNKFGYQINEIKQPNIIGRQYWNFVQIGTYENIGYSKNTSLSVPAKSIEEINRIYRSGVTVWHDHTNLGNYSLNNTIVST